MSKKLIAGAGVVASFAIALAPLATFAAENNYTSDEHTDHFEITVKPTCAFGHLAVGSGNALVGISHNTGGTGAYNDTAAWTEDETADVVRNTGRTPDNSTGTEYVETDTAAYDIEAGTMKEGFASTTLTVFCNNSTDAPYTLKVAMDANLTDGTNNIPALATYSASVSGYAIDSVSKTAGNGAINTTNFPASTKKAYTSETIMATSSTGTATTGDIYVVNYGIGVASTQVAGTYEGDVVYTLYQGVAD